VSTPHTESVRTLDYELHNDYLQALVDLGLPGLILFGTLFMLLIRLAFSQKEDGAALAAGGAVVALMVIQFVTFTSENVGPLAWMAGVAALFTQDSESIHNRTIAALGRASRPDCRVRIVAEQLRHAGKI
jgi:O-antigen ligase